jgi:trigger factor
MQVSESVSQGLKRELKVTIPAAELGSRLSDRLDQLKRTVRIKGFRPGKVPVAHLRRIYGKAAMAEIVERVVGETTQQAIAARNERVAMQPKIAMPEDEGEATKILDGDADLTFTLAYEVLPTFEVGEFKGLKIERPVAEVADAEVEERLRQLAESTRAYAAVERPAQPGDRVTFDYVGKTDGKAFETSTTAIVLGSGQFIPGFEPALEGVAAGETKTIEVTFPESYAAAHLAGKPASFEVTVKEVAEPGEIGLDDAFATRLGMESMERLRESVKQQIDTENKRAARQKIKRQMLDQLDAMHAFELPENLVSQEFEGIWRQITHDIEHHGKTFEAEGTTEEDARKEYRAIAERRVRLGLVLSNIGEIGAVNVGDDELRAALYAQARRYPGQERQVLEFYQKNPDALQALKAPIFEEKVVDYVLEFAEITEKPVSKEELFADEESIEPTLHHHAHDHDHDHEGHDHAHEGHSHA